jgi:DNA-binding transcriptional regulator GbsR (MarR family)
MGEALNKKPAGIFIKCLKRKDNPCAMDYQEGKQRFIEVWGRMAGGWGIPPAMGRVHALLLISPSPLTAEEVVRDLDISMSNANIQLRQLVDWGLVHRKPGGRKERFEAEKDIWNIVRQIIVNRKKRELEPVIAELEQLSRVEVRCRDSECFQRMVREMCIFSHRADQALTAIAQAEPLWLVNLLGRVAH